MISVNRIKEGLHADAFLSEKKTAERAVLFAAKNSGSMLHIEISRFIIRRQTFQGYHIGVIVNVMDVFGCILLVNMDGMPG